ncbi:L-asparaginase II [Azoarcus olearius]|uniref:asparaginase n=1 Tax=Azoarcus sp. (strain BH72) TaxID=418699 RepID=UPI0008062264|nr:asparaginase [Azoarcus olearius]ANQ83523.1 L-asparaginase II [Azoarcus olearius]
MPRQPVIALVATGGTIAGTADTPGAVTGYTAGVLGAEALLAAVPGLGEIAALRAETLFNLDSKDMAPAHWLALAQRVQVLADDPAIDGVVITHGTDTLEESAFFVHLTVATAKPVVFTAAMRPATALSADGPMNLLAAVRVAAAPAFHGLGTLVAINDRVYAARDVQKQRTHGLDAFGAGEGAAVGRSDPARPGLLVNRDGGSCAAALASAALPAVEVLYIAAGASPALLDAVRGSGAAGAVLAFPGNGSVPEAWKPAIDAALHAGMVLVRASRVPAGPVGHDTRLPASLLSAGDLPPSKARVALMLALACDRPQRFCTLAAPH